MQKLICQEWEESERGWGTRPDGCSLHLTEEDRKTFIKAYWDSMPETPPSEYSRPVSCYCEVDVDETAYDFEKLVEKHGIRLHEGDFREAMRAGSIKRDLAWP